MRPHSCLSQLLLALSLSLGLLASVHSLSADASPIAAAVHSLAPAATEYWRPVLHYTPLKNWINDPVSRHQVADRSHRATAATSFRSQHTSAQLSDSPSLPPCLYCVQNGLVYDNRTGLWHLFAQYNPNSEDGSDYQSWAHAVSSDLVVWQHWPVALLYGDGLDIWSGSAVLDYNSSGLCTVPGQPCMVAVYCSQNRATGNQSISIASSTDASYAAPFAKYGVVIDIHSSNFRDPAAFWYSTADGGRHAGPRYEGDADGYWLVVITHSDVHEMEFWRSADLIRWSLLSSFHTGERGNWDCPDFFPIREQSTGELRWVLTGSYSGTPGGYWVGHFDGRNFTTEQREWQLQDFGVDNYAFITYNDAPDDRRVSVAWLMAWDYSGRVPTAPWRGAGTIPRDLTLHAHNSANNSTVYLLHQLPVKELDAHTAHTYSLREPAVLTANSSGTFVRDRLKFAGGVTYEVNAVLNFSRCAVLKVDCTAVFLLRLDAATGQAMRIGVTVPIRAGPLVHFMNRSHSGVQSISDSYNAYWQPALPRIQALTDRSLPVEVRLLVDASAVEVFLQRGVVAASYQFFPLPDRDNYACELQVQQGEVVVASMSVHTFWQSPAPPTKRETGVVESE